MAGSIGSGRNHVRGGYNSRPEPGSQKGAAMRQSKDGRIAA